MSFSNEEIIQLIKDSFSYMDNRISCIESKLIDIHNCIEDNFNSEDEYHILNAIIDKLKILTCDQRRREAVELAEATLDKFELYMKNIDKVHSLTNEFKGCVAIARAAIAERKSLSNRN